MSFSALIFQTSTYAHVSVNDSNFARFAQTAVLQGGGGMANTHKWYVTSNGYHVYMHGHGNGRGCHEQCSCNIHHDNALYSGLCKILGYTTVLHSKRVDFEYGVVFAVYTRQICMLCNQIWILICRNSLTQSGRESYRKV